VQKSKHNLSICSIRLDNPVATAAVGLQTQMKRFIIAVALIYAPFAFAQGTFDNLDFEQAMPARYSGPVSAAQAIPDWTAEIGSVQQTEIYQNGFSTGAAQVVLLTQNPQQPPIDGNYSILIDSNPLASASISQTGQIPPGSQSLLFEAEPGDGPLMVTVGNDSLSLFPVAAQTGYEVYGANISAWAGQTEQITFTAVPYSIALNFWELDDISFSPTAIVPEPNPLALTSIGGVLFGLYRRFAPKRQ
jgi:hypothetical protein